jgi:photosystem II stability/assembly factor-like uncharacterized protein
MQKHNAILSFFVTLFLVNSVIGQETRFSSLQQNLSQAQFKRLSEYPVENIGPSVMGGRIVDIAVNPNKSTEFLVAYASGGLFYSNNNGQSFTPLFDHQESITIGDIDVDWLHRYIYVGTGENNSSRSSYAGTGIYFSSDWGKSWTNIGLRDAHHIGTVKVVPAENPCILVASMGHLYTPSAERGIFRFEDGKWTQTLFIDSLTGVMEIHQDPANAQHYFATAWHRERYPWNFVESGKSSGFYESKDGGRTWAKQIDNGLPQGDLVGRIGLSVCLTKPNIWYAVVDNQAYQTKKSVANPKLKASELRKMSSDEFLKYDSIKIIAFLKDNEVPKKYSYRLIASKIKAGTWTPAVVANYVSDADNDLYDTPVIGAEVYRSEDGGKHFVKTNEHYLDGVFNTYGYYFGKIYTSPTNDSIVYVLGVTLIQSKDGGKTFSDINGDNQHADHHVLWIDSKDDNHVINGNDGGMNISYDAGAHWIKCNTPSVGQFYAVAVDDAKPYHVYGGLQDNGVWVGPSYPKESVAWHEEGHYAYKRLLGGDGMQVQVDTRDNQTVYTGYQFGHYFKLNTNGPNYENHIHPSIEMGEEPLRFCWQTPILLSKYNKDILYMGSNRLHISLQQGKEMKVLSHDLTKGKRSGDVPYGTICTISESPIQYGLLYVGTDDGNLWVSKDGGFQMQDIRASINAPSHLRVMCVTASRFVAGRVYIVLSGFQFDDFKPYLFQSDDYGTTWKDISYNLPQESLNKVREDISQQDMIFVASDNGLYVNLSNNDYSCVSSLPRVAIHDMAIQEREGEMIIGTHGRSLYKMDIKALEKMYTANQQHNFVWLHTSDSIEFNSNWGKQKAWNELVPKPIMNFAFVVPVSSNINQVNVRIEQLAKKPVLVYESLLDCKEGFNNWNYNVSNNINSYLKDRLYESFLREGTYELTMTTGTGKDAKVILKTKFKVKAADKDSVEETPESEED